MFVLFFYSFIHVCFVFYSCLFIFFFEKKNSGIGASIIYPLLGVRINPNFSFLGTDVDEKSIQIATENVKTNKLEDKISLRLVEKGKLLLEVLKDEDGK